MILSPHNCPMRIVDAQYGIVAPVSGPRRNKVAIVAFGPTAREVHHLQRDPEWEIWGLNNGYNHPAMYEPREPGEPAPFRCDRWFELHEMHCQPPEDLHWLTQVCPVPVYIPNVLDPRIPNGVRFPIERVEALCPAIAPFWACSFAYQIALAIVEGFTTIGLFGFEFSSPREWVVERPNVLFWLGLAMGRGIEVLTPKETTLVQHPFRYGLEYDPECIWTDQHVHRLMGYWMTRLVPRCVEQMPKP